VEASRHYDATAADTNFEHLYRRYLGEVYRYALAVLRNPADAEDVVQTTFLNAYRAMQRGEQPHTPRNWLIKIAHNACRTRHLRLARRPQEVPIEDLENLPVPSEDLPDVKEVLEALGQLPFNQRAALVMRELEGRSYAEIGETLEISVGAVETLIFRARRGMKRRTALTALSAVQVPASLQSLFEGGGALAGGGALVGSGLLAKAAVVVAAGVVAGGVGYKTVNATILKHRADVAPQRLLPAAAARMFSAVSAVTGGRAAPETSAATAAPGRASKTDKRAGAPGHGRSTGTAGALSPGLPPASAGADHGRNHAEPASGAASGPGGSAVQTTVQTVASAASGLPGLPPIPSLPVTPQAPAPPSLPTVPVPTPPLPPVSVPTVPTPVVTLPLPPPPPPPKLP